MSLVVANVKVFLASDPVTYYVPAVNGLREGLGIWAFVGDPFHGPLFPAMVWGMSFLVGDVFRAGLLVGVLSYLLFVLAVFLVCREAFDSRVAFWVAFGVGLDWTLTTTTLRWLTDVLFAALCWLAIWSMYRSNRHSILGPIAAGCFSGLALTTRWNAAFLPIVACLYPILNPLHWDLRKRLVWIMVYGLAFTIFSSPWLLINWRLHGSPFYNAFIMIPQAVSLYYPSLVSPRFTGAVTLVNLVAADPVHFVVNYLKRFAWEGLVEVGQLLPFPIVILVAPGILAFWRGLDRRRTFLLLFFVVFWGLAALSAFDARYYIVLIPAGILLAVLFVLSEFFPDRSWGRLQISSKVVGLLLALTTMGAYTYRALEASVVELSAGPIAEIEATAMLKQHLHSDDTALVAVRYYSGARYFIPNATGMPTQSLPYPKDYLQPPPRFSHVFVEEAIPDPVGGEVDPSIYDPLLVPPDMEAIYYNPNAPYRAVLYRVLRDNEIRSAAAVTSTSDLDASHRAQAAIDSNASSGWIAGVREDADVSDSLTLDVGVPQVVNRVWILPATDPVLFPRTFNLQASLDGVEWEGIAGYENYPQIERQSPQVFSFESTTARYIRFTGVRLRPNAQGQYQMGLNEVRISLGHTQMRGLSTFEFTGNALDFDPRTGLLDIRVRNSGSGVSAAQVGVTVDWANTFWLESEPVAAGDEARFLVPLALFVPSGRYWMEVRMNPAHASSDHSRLSQTVEVPSLPTTEIIESLNLVPHEIIQSLNLISNPGFEALDGEWMISAPVHFDQSIRHSGAVSLRVDKPYFPDTIFYHVGTENYSIDPGPYLFGGWVKTQDLQESVRLIAKDDLAENTLFWDEPQPRRTDANAYGTGTQDWTLRVGLIPARAQAGQASVTVFMERFQRGSVWLDDVFLIPVYTTATEN
jgi:hypothetical protein